MNKAAIEFVERIVEVYGVHSCFENVNPQNSLEDEGLWFECPHCGDPILIGDDWSLEEVEQGCPICEEEFELE